MNKKTIMFVVPTLNKGGAERVVSVLANHFSNEFTVIIVSLGIDAPQYEVKAEFIRLNVGIYKNMLMKLFNILLRAMRIRRIIKSRRPDTVISFMESANIPSILATRLFTWHGSLIVSVRNNPLIFPVFYRWAIKSLYRIPKSVVAPSLGIKNDLEDQVFQNHGIDFIPNPIDYQNIRRQAKTATNYPFELPKEYLLAIGRLTYQKGFDRLISIFSKLKNKNLHLVILGEGELRDHLEGLIQSYGLTGRVVMPGLVDNPFPIYRNAVCLALTSRYEGWPNVINEAIATSCPVVSYNCKYGPNEILDNDNGFLIEEDDEQGFIKAIDILQSNEEVRRAMIDNGLYNVEQYSIERIAHRWLDIAGFK
jgi:GalNAc-alpha-(1->4)-GalNAc-alpha-(1->3)-diNAcBac-PP-undecaprenol alpha-1,4-N-acetyl-D-galactosaminyltransferase